MTMLLKNIQKLEKIKKHLNAYLSKDITLLSRENQLEIIDNLKSLRPYMDSHFDLAEPLYFATISWIQSYLLTCLREKQDNCIHDFFSFFSDKKNHHNIEGLKDLCDSYFKEQPFLLFSSGTYSDTHKKGYTLNRVSLLPAASERLSVTCIKHLSDIGADIFSKSIEGLTALHFSVLGNNATVLDYLCKTGISPDKSNNCQCSPIHWASFYGYEKCLKTLLTFSTTKDQLDHINQTALHHAVKNKHLACVELLLKNGYSPIQQNSYGSTPIHWAAYYGESSILNMLVQQTVTIDCDDSEKNTALVLAVKNGHEDCALTLLHHGARVLDSVTYNVDARLKTKMTNKLKQAIKSHFYIQKTYQTVQDQDLSTHSISLSDLFKENVKPLQQIVVKEIKALLLQKKQLRNRISATSPFDETLPTLEHSLIVLEHISYIWNAPYPSNTYIRPVDLNKKVFPQSNNTLHTSMTLQN